MESNVVANLGLQALGDVKNEASNQCIDSMWHSQMGQAYGLYGCHGQGGSQAFALSRSTGHIMPLANLEVCLLPSLKLGRCGPQAVWEFTDGHHLKNELTKECLTVTTVQGAKLAMVACDSADPNLKWAVGFQHDHPKEHIAADKLDAAHQAKLKSEFVESVKDRARAKAKMGVEAAKKKMGTSSSKTTGVEAAKKKTRTNSSKTMKRRPKKPVPEKGQKVEHAAT